MPRNSAATPLLGGRMSAGEQQADLTVQLGSSPSPWQFYYDSCHPVKGYVPVDDGQVSIYYEVHGLEPGRLLDEAQADRPKVVMIMGLACGCSGWRWQLQDLVQQHQMTPDFLGHPAPSGDQQHHQQQHQHQQHLQQAQQQWQQQHSLLQQQAGLAREQQQQQQMLVCVLDNRGVGRSSSPRDPAAYSTSIMAQDVLAVMAHLKWSSAHILGFSMGGMIAQALAAAAPRRVASLTLLSTSAGGWQILPHSWSGLRTALKMVTARTAEDAADATLHMHFRRRTLKTWVTHLAARRQELLRREYMQPDDAPPQPPHGFKGQLSACWKHRLSSRDVDAINRAGFPVLVIHGRSDKLASAANAEALARRLSAPCVILPGAHFIVRECAAQINMLLSNLVFGRQHLMAPSNTPYMDPSPSLQKVWFKVDSPPTAVAQGSAGSQQLSGQQQAWPGQAAAAANTSGRQLP